MPLVRRSPPVAKTPVVTAETRPPLLRRLRVVANNAGLRQRQAQQAREEIDLHLKSIATLDDRIDSLLVELNAEHAKVEELLRAAKIDEHSDGRYKAMIEPVATRQSRTVDAKRFKNAVADKDFWSCIKVNITEAAKILSERELNDISTIEPGKITGYAFKLKRLDKGK